MSSAENATQLVKELAPAISWLLVIIGWLFVSRDHNRRELRKETRAHIGKIQELIDRIEAQAVKYWTSAPGEESDRVGSDLKRDLHRLGRHIARLSKVCPLVSAKSELIEFRRAVSGGDFESTTRAALSASAGRLSEIWDTAQELAEKLEAGFALQYPPK